LAKDFKDQSHHVGMKSSLTLPWANGGKWIGIFEKHMSKDPIITSFSTSS
jgi:hypothetical protein